MAWFGLWLTSAAKAAEKFPTYRSAEALRHPKICCARNGEKLRHPKICCARNSEKLRQAKSAVQSLRNGLCDI
jgi:hypothetical protein